MILWVAYFHHNLSISHQLLKTALNGNVWMKLLKIHVKLNSSKLATKNLQPVQIRIPLKPQGFELG